MPICSSEMHHSVLIRCLSRQKRAKMDYALEDYVIAHNRKNELIKTLNYIQETILGDDVRIESLLVDKNGNISNARAESLAQRIAYHVDCLEKGQKLVSALLYKQDGWSAVDDRRKDSEWQSLLEQDRDYDQVISFNLACAPTALSDIQRKTIENLAYCLLIICSCEALSKTTVCELRKILKKTAEFTERWELDETGELPEILTEEDLILRELVDEVEHYGGKVWVAPPIREDLFSLVDCVYEVLNGRPATELVDDEKLERVKMSEKGRNCLKDTRAMHFTWDVWGDSGFRPMTSLDENTWKELDQDERIQKILEVLDDCEDIPWSFELEVIVSQRNISGERDWYGLDIERQRQILRQLLAEQAIDANPPVGDITPVSDDIHAFHRQVSTWAQRVECIDNLFERYNFIRKHFFSEDYSLGADPYVVQKAYCWLPEGFYDVLNTAIDTVLNEGHYSFLFDDDVYERMYAFLRKTAGQMDYAIAIEREDD